MGIKGLHGLLKSIQKPCNLKKFSGQTLGVDAYGWLHRGTIACSVDLVLDKPTTKHIDFVLNRVRMLLYFGITPYLVFDGDDLPSKSGTESDRHERRKQSKALGLELQRKGRMAEAYQELQKAVDVTPYMARQLIEELKKLKIQYVVAPYEADAQLVYLEREGIINGIISEDSDMLVFGAKRLLSKLDQHGDCIELNRADFTACREVSLIGWTDADFRRMCILSGCDYLPNIAKMGLKTAYRSIRKYKNVERALRMIQFEGNYHVPSDYLENFNQAELTFLYQRVFCPKAGKLVTLTPPENDIKLDELPFIGADVDPVTAVAVAQGDLDPATKEPIVLKPLEPSKLAPGLHRRQTLGSSAELKPSKPINSFFTPKRTPLAELDPNTLSPSPSQQRLLQRHANSSWESSPAPTRSNTTRSASSIGQSHRISSPVVRSVERDSFLARAARMSTFQPTKRQRLCSEADDEALPTQPDCRSRFFAHAGEEASPSGHKMNRTKKPRKSNLEVFSDESAEDIMTQIAGPENSPETSTNKGQAGQADEKETAPDSESPSKTEDAGQTPQVASEAKEGLATSHEQPEKSVSHESHPEVFNQVLDYHIGKQNSTLLSKYTFKAGAVRDDNKSSPQTTTLQRQHSFGFNSRTSSPRRALGAQGQSPRRQRLTPLQRLGQTALSRSRSINIPTIKGLGARSGESKQGSVETNTVHNNVPNLVANGGSEDLIVPDSEDDDDSNLSDGGDRPQPISLNLKRFSFAAK
ncbi:hypothetical protein ASPWEDRAFT_52276 [Aspergillus wentii DTO 134E9]|uniref:Uncharacterized protein n=1 Tax=Aspergillus wentii DTO 134E9 TaxID=1073089 RepID=A0A1L9RGA6_ASPWE|nr:uncharacterized protein ASPWEDRAFT_52276 [Aspergillus wentii DTO 134E9]KAI9925660.1 Rad2 nuclease [Aspergillus wentii]OJJ33898.1 hypothetical protein ASPWEDRAFT_52276 [Aspergillus wentii DTO 134E9]